MWAIDEGESFPFLEHLKKSVFGQKRTSRQKQFVIFDDNNVWKGPYKRSCMKALAERYDKVCEWNLPLVVLPERKFYTSENIEGVFFRFDNISGDNYSDGYDWHTESFSTYTYRVNRRSNLLKISDLLKKSGHEWIYNYVPEMTITLCLLTLLGAGDLHTCNIMANLETKTVHIIDFDQNRAEEPTGDFFFLSKPPAKATAKIWKIEMTKYKKKIIDFINKIEIAPQQEKERKKMIEFFEQLELEKPSIVDTNNLGYMMFNGPFNSRTYSNLSVDIVKSGLQKYIRRNEVDDALIMAFEMLRMREINAKAIVTNFANRISIIAVEDIGPANLPLVKRILEKPISELPDVEIYSLIVQMCNSPKTRILSHLARAYNKSNYKISRKYGIDIERESHEDDPLNDDEFWFDGDDESLKQIGNIFLQRLRNRDVNAFVWGQYYHEKFGDMKVAPRNRRRKASVVLWRMMESETTKENLALLTLLEKYFFTLTEDKPFLRLAIYLTLNGNISPGSYSVISPTLTIEQLLTGEYEAVVKDYIVDKHTAQGKMKGADRKVFTSEGAHINNEDMRFSDDTLKKIYDN